MPALIVICIVPHDRIGEEQRALIAAAVAREPDRIVQVLRLWESV